jgi:hypothetical protein
LGVASLAWAEGDPPSPPQFAGPESWCVAGANTARHGPGMLPGLHQWMANGSGCSTAHPMQATMHAALAAGLGISQEEFDTRLAAGQTPAEVAADLGLSRDAVYDLMRAAHAAAWQSLEDSGSVPGTGGMPGPWHARRMSQPRGPMNPACPRYGQLQAEPSD